MKITSVGVPNYNTSYGWQWHVILSLWKDEQPNQIRIAL